MTPRYPSPSTSSINAVESGVDKCESPTCSRTLLPYVEPCPRNRCIENELIRIKRPLVNSSFLRESISDEQE